MKRKQSLGAVLAALVVAMVACGIDAAGEASRAPSAQPPVKIGVAPSLNVSVSGMVDLGLADVRDINDAGEIVGTIDVAGHQHAALLVSGKVYDLGTTDNSGTTPASSSASGINRVGQVVGHGAVGTEEYNFVWTPDAPNGTTGTMRRLLPAPDGSVGHAVRINDAGQVIGNSVASALLWTGGQVVQLGTLMEGGRSGAEAINNFGQVVGTAVRDTPSGDEWRAFLWTPDVPN